MFWGGHETITSIRMTVGVATKVSLGLLFEKTTMTTKEGMRRRQWRRLVG